MLTPSDILSTLQNSKPHLQQRFGIARIGVYGSYVNGTAHDESDVDIVFDVVEGRRLKLSEYEALEEYLAMLLATLKIDLVQERYMNPVIRYTMQGSVRYV
jgi:predicted nucleotidyltransferase